MGHKVNTLDSKYKIGDRLPGGQTYTSEMIRSWDDLPAMSQRGQAYSDYMQGVTKKVLNGTYKGNFYKFGFVEKTNNTLL